MRTGWSLQELMSEVLVATAYEGHQNLKVTCYSSGFCPTTSETREDLVGSNTDDVLKATGRDQ